MAEVLQGSSGTGFREEAYFTCGGIDAVDDDMGPPTGLARFAPVVASRGHRVCARGVVRGSRAIVEPVSSESF
ncbi:hypothetical protein IU470_18010 [Nocardia abscessus]|uniref:Uncharacterized protein n=1 Tax=Nocardia abscessus TaxID=120957 RepID=A0ABS0CEE6_9NOCA|nr:hypothetical protein [Nocardia abscessus]MBF6226994.1 hypothetical protein [Nocardia abscessus]